MSKNDITGDSLTTGAVSDKYRDNYDAIFGDSKKLLESKNLISKLEDDSNGNRIEDRRQTEGNA